MLAIMIIMRDKVKCLRCGEIMIDIQVCHMLCPNCGAVMDCSDKGSIW